MKKKIFKLLLIASVLNISIANLTGCHSKKNNDEEKKDEIDYDSLEEGNYFVLRNNECIPVYFGKSTFKKEPKEIKSVSNERVFWFKDDYPEIPTLYKDDTLIYYSSEELKEVFTFERFEDFGYSIGIRGLEETLSGRYSVSTDPGDNTAYPDGDTSNIYNYEQDNVIIDEIGGTELNKELNTVSRCGTILNLKKDQNYKVKVFTGTLLSEGKTQIYKSDIRILGAMETFTSNDFKFINDKVISIAIPEFFNSGYYNINNMGLFKYINEPYSEKIKELEQSDNYNLYNVPNINPDELDVSDAELEEEAVQQNDEYTFMVDDLKSTSIEAYYTANTEDTEILQMLRAITSSPSNDNYEMANDTVNKKMTLTFNANVKGEYKVKFYKPANVVISDVSIIVNNKENNKTKETATEQPDTKHSRQEDPQTENQTVVSQ